MTKRASETDRGCLSEAARRDLLIPDMDHPSEERPRREHDGTGGNSSPVGTADRAYPGWAYFEVVHA